MSRSKKARMEELIEILNKASYAYYQQAEERMSNLEYDALYEELVALEKETGITRADSPTVNVGYEVVSQLPKEKHERPMLSLDKTKSAEELTEFLGAQKGVLSWKMDGLTIVLTYREGRLYKAVTRGNGETGEIVTPNAKTFRNLPLKIKYSNELILRGEAVIGYRDFEEINRKLPEVEAKYKNPRNLCSGSVRQLNSQITKSRRVSFYGFSVVKAEGVDFGNSRKRQLDWLEEQGFEVVEHCLVTQDTLRQAVEGFSSRIGENDFPSDGLVLNYDDIAYGESLGQTSKFPRDSMAFKWEDEKRETTLLSIEWSPSRTGLINPVAIFEPVELEGTTVSRASVHNISILEELELGIGDRLLVYKANMIIPQIAENLTKSGNLEIPSTCPVCQGKTSIRQTGSARALYCDNPDCQAKQIKAFTLFVSRDAMNIEGLSEASLEKFVGKGFIQTSGDIFRLSRYREEICQMEGFGEKSFRNLADSIEKARDTSLPRLIYSLGIANIGLANAKLICGHFDQDPEKVMEATAEELGKIDGIGPVIAAAFEAYFSQEKNRSRYLDILEEIRLEENRQEASYLFREKVFVVTGSVARFSNRSQLKEWIEARGGKVTGSVTSKTSFLINNDTGSTSSKNKKARELNIPILSEEELLAMAGQPETDPVQPV
ncbi:NAD-dependent DNA ligase LigA [Suipraeoptans intestinalis]|uniref:NAD-dependent DNA ligase LigA n=2 Tax=Suipraeoptans intestinalis TaxID=2606628 RepID=UPI002A757D0B|nr:NAD-dependent DNA ligase LigA [Suipraeoptans intestinalis]MDY3122539.1 NAD-dependent DNA ligase LigA [Suipraeoptans intestinalis]